MAIYKYGSGSISCSIPIHWTMSHNFQNGNPIIDAELPAPNRPDAQATLTITCGPASAIIEPLSELRNTIGGSIDIVDQPRKGRVGYRVTVGIFGASSGPKDHWLNEEQLDYNTYKTVSGTLDTTFDVEVPCDNCYEETLAGQLSIIDAPFPRAARIFQVYQYGANGSVSCASESASGAVESAMAVATSELTFGVSAYADNTGGGSWSAEVPDGYYVPSDPVHSSTASDANGSASASAMSLSLSATAYHTATAGLGSILYRLKSFNLSGVVRAQTEPYPDGLTGTCAKFAGDTDTDFAIGGGTFSVSGSQRNGSINAGYTGATAILLADFSVNEFAPISCSIKPFDALKLSASGDDPRATRLMLRGRTFGALSISKANVTVDAGNSLTPTGAWAGSWEAVSSGGTAPTVSGGGIAFSGSARRTFTHDVSFTGSRHLRLTLKASAANAPFTLAIGGKSWTAKAGADSSAFSQIDIDLAAENSETATTSTHDTKWPLQRDDDLTGDDLPISEGAYFGVQRVSSVSLSGAIDTAFIVSKIEIVTKGAITCDAVPAFYRGQVIYRNGNPIGIDEGWPTQQYPDRSFGTGGSGTSTYFARRGLLINADGVQMEQEDSTYQIDTPPDGSEGDPFLSAFELPIKKLVDNINRVNSNGTILNPGYVAVSSKPSPVSGCDVTLPSFNDCYLNEERPAAGLHGAGAFATATATGWDYGWDKELGAIGQWQQGYDSFDWFPEAEDWAGFGGASPSPRTQYLRAAGILRGAGHGLTLKASKKPTAGRMVSLLQGTPAPGLMVSQGKSKVNGFYKMSSGPFAKTVQPGTVKGIGESVNFSDLYGRKRQRVVLVGDACLDLLAQDDHYFPFTPQFSDPAALPYENVTGLTTAQTTGNEATVDQTNSPSDEEA